MNFKELQERAKGRNFDQITVVSRDIFQELANLSLVFPVAPGKVRTETEQNHPGLTVGKPSTSGIWTGLARVSVVCGSEFQARCGIPL